MKTTQVTGYAKTVLVMAENAAHYGQGPVHVANPEDKRGVEKLEKLGLVTIRRTDDKCGGYSEWWVTLKG